MSDSPLSVRLRRVGAVAVVAVVMLVACNPETSVQPAVGSITVDITGLPDGQDANVTITGPADFTETLTASATIDGLAFGEYAIDAQDVVGAAGAYRVIEIDPAQFTVATDASPTVLVRYEAAPTEGQLVVEISGLPAGVDADVTVTGPEGLSWTVTGTTVLSALVPGEYQLTASDLADYIVHGEASHTAEVKATQAASAEFTYTERPVLAVTAHDVGLSLDASGSVSFTLVRPDGIDGPVTLELTPPTGLTVAADSMNFGAGNDTVSTTISDAGASIGTHEVEFTAVMPDCEGCLVVEGSFNVTVSAMVTSAIDADTPGTLRYLLNQVRADEITFDPALATAGELLIHLTDSLHIDREVTITGLDWSDRPSPVVILNGHGAITPLIIDTEDDTAVVRLEHLHVHNGHSDADGGGIRIHPESTAQLHSVRITENWAGGHGGGIHNNGTLTITGATLIAENQAVGSGAGISNHGVMDATDATITDNLANQNAGGIYNDGSATLVRTAVTSNMTIIGDGGGIYHGNADSDLLPDGTNKEMTISGSLIAANSANNGGGIFSVRKLTIEDTEIAENLAGGAGGGISSRGMCSNLTAGVNGGELHVIRSSIHHNWATESGGGLQFFSQSCTYPRNLITTVTIVNSSIAYNSGEDGGGISLRGSNHGQVNLYFNTIVGNHAHGDTTGDGGVGGGINAEILQTEPRLQGNLIAFNTAALGDDSQDIAAGNDSLESGGNNFVTVAPTHFDALPSDRVETIETEAALLQLASEAQFESSTWRVIAMPPSSTAAKHVPVAGCQGPDGAPLETDQRGLPRPVESRCSVGAYQVQ